MDVLKKTILHFIKALSLLTIGAQNRNEVRLFKAAFNRDKTNLLTNPSNLTLILWAIYKSFEAEIRGAKIENLPFLENY